MSEGVSEQDVWKSRDGGKGVRMRFEGLNTMGVLRKSELMN